MNAQGVEAEQIVTSMATVTVIVTPVNDAPVAVDDSASVKQRSSVVVDFLANDTDVDNDNSSLTLTSGLTLTADNGSVTVNADGTLTYTPSSSL